MIWGDLVGEVVRELVLPVVGSILLGYGALAAAKLREKTGVDITDKLNVLLNRALERIVAALLLKIDQGELPGSANIVQMAVQQLEQIMPDTIKKLGATKQDLITIASNAVARMRL